MRRVRPLKEEKRRGNESRVWRHDVLIGVCLCECPELGVAQQAHCFPLHKNRYLVVEIQSEDVGRAALSSLVLQNDFMQKPRCRTLGNRRISTEGVRQGHDLHLLLIISDLRYYGGRGDGRTGVTAQRPKGRASTVCVTVHQGTLHPVNPWLLMGGRVWLRFQDLIKRSDAPGVLWSKLEVVLRRAVPWMVVEQGPDMARVIRPVTGK